MRICPRILSFLFLFALISCSHHSKTGTDAGSERNTSATGQKISQFEKAGFSDFLIAKDGSYHVVFQESPDNGKPVFIYYTTSTDGGGTWSKPVTLSNDNTGNGAGCPRILQDGNGVIYAIWKRYGDFTGPDPKPDQMLDGPGGNCLGTIFYKVLNGGTWSDQVQVSETQRSQASWFATITPKGQLRIFWSELSPASISSHQYMSYFCDLLRNATISGSTHSAPVNMNTPSEPAYEGGAPKQEDGATNMDGYVDQNDNPHMIWEDKDSTGINHLKYFDGKSEKFLYTYPHDYGVNTFTNPAKLLRDEHGNDHVIFKPLAALLESEQIWDIDAASGKSNVLVAIQKKGVTISGFQANQGPGGQMAVTIEAGGVSDNTEAFGSFYKNGDWKNMTLTNNASKEQFFSRGFDTPIGTYYLSSLTRYSSEFNTVAYDADGHKYMAMTISAIWSGDGIQTSSPSLVFSPID